MEELTTLKKIIAYVKSLTKMDFVVWAVVAGIAFVLGARIF